MNVLVVDCEPLMREVVAKICTDLGHAIVAAAATADEAASILHARRPDLIVLDAVLDSTSGFEVLRRTAPMQRRVFILCSRCRPYLVWRASQAEAHGFMAKEEVTVASLTEAVATVAAGGQYWSDRYRQTRLALLTDPFSFVKILTDAEMRILGLVGRGLDDSEISRFLAIAPRTVQTHRSNISRKLGIPSSVKLMAYAISCGLDHFEFRQDPPLLDLPADQPKNTVRSTGRASRNRLIL